MSEGQRGDHFGSSRMSKGAECRVLPVKLREVDKGQDFGAKNAIQVRNLFT